MKDQITLDRETFKVLAADTRVEILKKLDKRKKTLTDLAQEMEMSPSTIKEHIDKLVHAGLIEHIDRGTKWKYYKLTEKGRSIVSPYETKVWVLLGISVLMLCASLISFQANLYSIGSPMVASKMMAPASEMLSQDDLYGSTTPVADSVPTSGGADKQTQSIVQEEGSNSRTPGSNEKNIGNTPSNLGFIPDSEGDVPSVNKGLSPSDGTRNRQTYKADVDSSDTTLEDENVLKEENPDNTEPTDNTEPGVFQPPAKKPSVSNVVYEAESSSSFPSLQLLAVLVFGLSTITCIVYLVGKKLYASR